MHPKHRTEEKKENNRWFRRGKAADAVRAILQDARTIRIASAFFELSGYRILDDILDGKTLKLLIGNEESSSLKMESFLSSFIQSIHEIENIEERLLLLQKFRSQLKSGVISLGISAGQNRGAILPAHKAHHAKLYIADHEKCIVTSANFTGTGLRYSLEAGYLVEDPEDVAYFVSRFDEIFTTATPLTQSLLEAIDDLLSLRTPYEVYARSLLEIYGLPEADKIGQLPPLADYQKPLVAGILHSVREHGGAMLVASTGLGKTVMASHVARLLRNDGSIDRVMVFCPAGLKDMWSRSLRSANVSSREFTFHILSLDDWEKYRDVQYLEEELNNVNEFTLLIVDESHHLRNEKKIRNKIRLRNDRIQKAVGKKARILLMTATPYSKGVNDINAQLNVLPNTRMTEMFRHRQAKWKIDSPGELSNLEIASVMTAPTVVTYFSQTDDNQNRFILYNNSQKKYFPRIIQLRTCTFSNETNPLLQILLESNLLRRKEKNPTDVLFSDSPEGVRDGFFEAKLIHQFCSSLHYARETLKKIHSTENPLADEEGYEKMRFANPEELKTLTSRLIERAGQIGKEDKFDKLCEIIDREKHNKIVIFVIYRETARDLHEKLRKKYPDIRIERTSDENMNLDSILERFAPIACGVISPGQDDVFSRRILSEKIDILIATEAVSEGYNLQDASILINYDLPWTVLHLAQRMGRILRPWHEPRNIQIWNFFPDTMDSGIFHIAQNWQRRLMAKSSEQASFSKVPVLMKNDSEDVPLYSYAGELKEIFNHDVNLNETLDFIDNAEKIQTSTVFDDLAKMNAETAREVKKIKTPFRSARLITSGEESLFVLFRRKSHTYTIVFGEKGETILGHREPMEALKKIKASPEDPGLTDVSLVHLETWLEKARESFLRQTGFPAEETEVICSLAMLRSAENMTRN